MFTIEEIKNYSENYYIQNGVVFSKSDRKQIVNEDIILKVKSARLIYNEARDKYQSDTQQFGKPNGDFQRYVTKTMEQLSVNGEVNNYGTNKLLNAILSSNGHIVENFGADTLANSKYDLLIEPKKDYTMAYLKLKFREKGLDIDGLTITCDYNKQIGIATVTIDYQLKKYEKKTQVDTARSEQVDIQNNSKQTQSVKAFSHPQADLLNELEQQKKDAQMRNDEVAYNFAQSNIERIIRENPVEVTPEQWDSMGYDERKSFILIKMKESKVLNDEVNFNFWNSNLKQLDANISAKKEQADTPSNSDAPKVEEIEKKEQIVQSEKSYYDLMISALNKSRMGNLTDEEKKQIVGEIYYYEGYLVNSVKSEKEIADIMTKAINDFQSTDFEQSIFNSLLSELQDKLKSFVPQSRDNITTPSIDKEQFSASVNNLKQEMQSVSISYKQMLSDGMIDDKELDLLISAMQKLGNTANSIKGNNLSPTEYQVVNEILASISSEKEKMMGLRDGIEQSVQRFGR